MSKAILVVLGQFTEDVEARIGREFTVRRVSSDAPTRYEDLLRAADGADAVFMMPVRLDAEFFRRVAASVKVIATFSVGYDHIDVRGSREKNCDCEYSGRADGCDGGRGDAVAAGGVAACL